MTKTISICLFLLISAINFPAFGEETQGQNAQTLLQEVRKLIAEEKHEEAAGQLEAILKQFPDTPQAKDSILLLAASYVKIEQPEKAESTYLNALDKYQNDAVYINRIHNVLADFYISQKQYEKSIEQLQSILQTKPTYKTVLPLYEKIVSGYIAMDQPDKAADTLQILLQEYPGLVDKYSTDTSVLQYHRLRTQVDTGSFTAETTSRIAYFYEKSNHPDLVNAAYELLTEKFPESPYSIKGFRWLADNLATHNKYAEAVPFYLKSIIGSTKPIYSFKARLPENRIHLDAFNKERLTSSETGKIARDLYVFLGKDKKTGLAVSESELSTIQLSWEKAHKFVESNQFDKATAIYQEISQETQNPLNSLARYFISLCLSYQGNDRDAVAELTSFLEDESLKEITSRDTLEQVFEKTLNVYALTLAGYCYFNLGNYGKAEEFLKKISEKSLTAAYKLAQAYEFQGKLKEARIAYQGITTIENKELSDLSLFSVNRINSLEKSLASLSVRKAPEVLYIGEDRITKGNWRYNYGKELTILCGFNAPADWVEGAEQENFKYDVYTGNPKDTAKTWLSKSFETAEYFLQYPGETEKRRPCNWDDHGETYPLGKGPDLFVSLSIPAGRHKLALYFLNDPNYYEPNRQYTVYIQDKNGAVLSATSVEDFYSGVYKRFLVTGPTEITIRIFRNLSLNTLLSGVFIDSYKPDDFPTELLVDCDNGFQNIKNKIIGIYDQNTEIATKPDFAYVDFENSKNLWQALSETVSDIYQKESVSWNKICIGFSLAHLFHQNWQYKERDGIVQKTLKDWQEFPKSAVNKEEAINSQISLISQIYQTEWIKGIFKMEFTRNLIDSITKFLTGEKASYVSHRLIQTIPTGKSVSYQPWIYEFIIYEKLMESKLADPFDMRKLGILYIDRGDPAKALPIFRQMVKATDDIRIKQDAYSRIMTVYARLSKEEEMKKTLKELQTLDPVSSTSQGGEIKLYTYLSENGKKEEAYEILKNFASKYPDSEYLPFVRKQLEKIENK